MARPASLVQGSTLKACGQQVLEMIRGVFSLRLLANHFPMLHGFRVLAIVAVVQYHLTAALARQKLIPKDDLYLVATRIFFGMDLFFILSGFLIGTMLLHGISTEDKKTEIGRFYLRRAFRTFPAYYVVLTIFFLSTPENSSRLTHAVSEFLYLTNYTRADGHKQLMSWGWSLCVEEHFYLLVPFLLLGIMRLNSHRARLIALCLLWAAGLCARFVVYVQHRGSWGYWEMFDNLYVKTHTRFDILVAGVLLAYLQHYFAARIALLLARRAVRLAFILVPCAACWLLVSPPPALYDILEFHLLAWGTITSIMYVPLILWLIHRPSLVSRFLAHRAFLWIATLGYGIYLLHPPLVSQVVSALKFASAHGFRLQPGATWTLGLALSISISACWAYLLHLIVEKPALYLRDKLVP